MSFKIVPATLALSLVAQSAVFAGTLAAADTSNYFSVSGGAGWASDIDRTMTSGQLQKTMSVEFGNTFGVTAAYGRQIRDWLRIEGELGYTNSEVKEVTEILNSDMKESGNEQFYSAMLNGIYDIKNSTAFTPFLGGGIGIVYAKHDVDFDPISTDMSPGVDSNESDTVLGGQLLAGVNWKYSDTVAFEATYRYFYVSEREHSASFQPNGKVDIDAMSVQLIMLGAKYSF